MIETEILTHLPIILRPDPSRTVIRPFEPGDPAGFGVPGQSRQQRIADRVLRLGPDEVAEQLALMAATFEDRHRNVDALLLRRFAEVHPELNDCDCIEPDRQRLIGAYFSEEYSYEAAALFNPSIVLHDDQAGLPANTLRFAMSLRGIGEGHVSSVTFRTGTWGPEGVTVDAPSQYAVPPRIETIAEEPDAFRLVCEDSQEISETVLFPVAPSQKQGIEDMRLVRFVEDDGEVHYLGTYTAFSGSEARSELLQGTGFNSFVMRPMRGVVAGSKGTALFPRKVNGKYMLLGRQDNENIWLLESDNVLEWNGGKKLLTPEYPWEFVQIGNCGSPIEIDEGWLVLTHGVGVVRNYCMGACLLDKDDPSRVLKRMTRPLLKPSPDERDGYVPNVVYSCGALVHDRTLLLPFGVADNFASFATAPVDAILAAME